MSEKDDLSESTSPKKQKPLRRHIQNLWSRRDVLALGAGTIGTLIAAVIHDMTYDASPPEPPPKPIEIPFKDLVRDLGQYYVPQWKLDTHHPRVVLAVNGHVEAIKRDPSTSPYYGAGPMGTYYYPSDSTANYLIMTDPQTAPGQALEIQYKRLPGTPKPEEFVPGDYRVVGVVEVDLDRRDMKTPYLFLETYQITPITNTVSTQTPTH